METIYADMTVSMSEFKKNPASVLRRSGSRPVAVLSHSRAAFYMVEPRLFQAMLDELALAKPDSAAVSLVEAAGSISGSHEAAEASPAYRAVFARLGARIGAFLGGKPEDKGTPGAQ
jgi:PHD/YefM family antitoxin component YafN of YafNO toxin-antitoxin module